MKREESNPTGMTLDELDLFVQAARRDEFPGSTRIRTVAKINGKMFKVSIDDKDRAPGSPDRKLS